MEPHTLLFNSISFYLVFLPLSLVAFYSLRKLEKLWLVQCFLIAVSLLFYAGHGADFLGLLAVSVLVTYFVGHAIFILSERNMPSLSRTLTVLVVCGHLALIAYYKYRNFFLDSVYSLFGEEFDALPLILPLAISFFTFQQIGFVVDVYKRQVTPPRNFLDFSLFVTFFPQLIAGPITLYQELQPQFARGLMSIPFGKFFLLGCAVFAVGLFKKVAFADQAAYYASLVFSAADAGQVISQYDAWLGAFAFTSQIYFDFSGYSEMACGLALMFGLRVPMNFFSPYRATSIAEFWRRWHISLSRFLRDYVYIPFGGNRSGPARTSVNLFATMLIGGLWHGAAWTFVLWGGLHGIYLVVAQLFGKVAKHKDLKLPGFISWALTMLCVIVAWVFFRASTFDGALTILSAMFFGTGSDVVQLSGSPFTVLSNEASVLGPWIVPLSLLVATTLPNIHQMLQRYSLSLDIYSHLKTKQSIPKQEVKTSASRLRQRCADLLVSPLILAAVTVIVLVSITFWQMRDSSYSEFIYFNF